MPDEECTSGSGRREPEGKYANHFRIGYNAFEFLVDFGQFYDGNDDARVHTRVITSPVYVLELMEMLLDAIREYEKAYGEIKNIDDDI